jgi:hypothetical protein
MLCLIWLGPGASTYPDGLLFLTTSSWHAPLPLAPFQISAADAVHASHMDRGFLQIRTLQLFYLRSTHLIWLFYCCAHRWKPRPSCASQQQPP